VSEFVMLDCTTYWAGYDMTTDLNKMGVKVDVEDKDATVFGRGGWKRRAGGLKDFTLDLSGFWQAGTGTIDPEAFGALGVEDRVVTVSPTGAQGDVAYLGQVGEFGYELFGQIGDLTPFSLTMPSTGRAGLVRGRVAKAKGAHSATGVVGGAVRLTGGVAAGQGLYATVHVFTPGTTITLKVQHATDAGFTSPVDVATLPAITAKGGTWAARVAGPFAGPYFRLTATAVTGSFTLAAAIGAGT